MADPQEIRQVLRAHGIDVPAKGRIREEYVSEYERITAGDDDGVSAADFGGDDGGQADAPGPAAGDGAAAEGPPPGVRPETRPRAVSEPQAARGRGLFGRARPAAGKAKTGRGKAKTGKAAAAWVPTAPMIERLWGQLAASVRLMPPMAKILAAQAPMAGIALEQATRDTIIDSRFFQPAARAEERIAGVTAVVGPPVMTAAICMAGSPVMTPAGEPVTNPDGSFVWDDRTRVLIGGLKFTLMTWLEISGRNADQIQATAEHNQHLSDEVDKLIAFILAPPEKGKDWEQTEREARAKGAELIAAHAAAGAAPAPAAPPAPLHAVARPDDDPRIARFVPPDPLVPSQQVRPAPMPQA